MSVVQEIHTYYTVSCMHSTVLYSIYHVRVTNYSVHPHVILYANLRELLP